MHVDITLYSTAGHDLTDRQTVRAAPTASTWHRTTPWLLSMLLCLGVSGSPGAESSVVFILALLLSVNINSVENMYYVNAAVLAALRSLRPTCTAWPV
jgi:hypothetical protein